MKRFDNIEETLCNELDKLDKKYAGDTEMSAQDLETLRMLLSSVVKLDTHYAMKEESEMDEEGMDGSGRRGSYGRIYPGHSYAMRGEEDGRSYRRARDAMGRFTSRDMGPEYSGDDGYSGHYPMDWMPPYMRNRY